MNMDIHQMDTNGTKKISFPEKILDWWISGSIFKEQKGSKGREINQIGCAMELTGFMYQDNGFTEAIKL